MYFSITDKRIIRRSIARNITLHWDGKKLFKSKKCN